MPTIKKYQERDKKAEYAYKFYLNKGYTPQASASIVGNLIHEGGLNTTAEGDVGYKGGSSFGVAQWRGDRLNKLKSMYGKDWNKLDNQLEFVHWELNNTEKSAGDALKKAKSVWEAGRVFTNSYERPKLKFDQDETRQTHVADVYRNYAKMQLTEEEKNMFKPTFSKDVAPYMNMQSNNISILPETEINTTFAQVPQVEIDYLNQLEQQTQLPQQTETAQVTQQEDTFMQDLLAEISKGVEYVKPVERGIMQSGGTKDIYGNPITTTFIKKDIPRTYYNRRTGETFVGNDFLEMSEKDKKELIAHENRHDWQYKNDRSNFEITHNPEYAFNEKLQKKPSIVNTDEIYNNYHNRQQKETDLEINKIKSEFPQFSFVPNQIMYDKGFTDSLYDNPYSLEGEAQYYQNTGERSFQKGGIIKDNNGYWNPENWGQQVEISSPSITMKGVNQPLWGLADTGELKFMMPEQDYYFKNATKVVETPIK